MYIRTYKHPQPPLSIHLQHLNHTLPTNESLGKPLLKELYEFIGKLQGVERFDAQL
jgi:hypothetical protein